MKDNDFIEKLVIILLETLRYREQRKQLIEAFQKQVWNGTEHLPEGPVSEILEDLAYDLDYHVAAPDLRREDASYYGDERLELEIRTALSRLKDSGVSVPRRVKKLIWADETLTCV